MALLNSPVCINLIIFFLPYKAILMPFSGLETFFNFLVKDLKNVKVLSFGMRKDADISCELLDHKKILIKTPKYDLEIKSKLLGHNNISNILAAATCAYHLKINPKKIKEGIENISPIPSRLELKEGKKRAAIIYDTYNANP